MRIPITLRDGERWRLEKNSNPSSLMVARAHIFSEKGSATVARITAEGAFNTNLGFNSGGSKYNRQTLYMACTYVIDSDRKLIITTLLGVVNAAEAFAHQE